MAWERLCRVWLKLFQMGLKCSTCSKDLPGDSATDARFDTGPDGAGTLPRLGLETGSSEVWAFLPPLPLILLGVIRFYVSPWSLTLTKLCLICLSLCSCDVACQGLPQAWKAVCHVVNVILEISQWMFLLYHDVTGLCNWVA